MDGLGAGGSDATGAKLACVGVPDEGGFARDELGALGWAGSDDFEHGLEVDDCSSLGGAGVDADGGLVGLGAAVKHAIKWGEEGCSSGDGVARMLTFAQERLESLPVHVAMAQELVARVAKGLDFAGGELDGAVVGLSMWSSRG